MSSKWSWPSSKSQSSAPTRGPPHFYILINHSLSAGLPRWAQSQQCTIVYMLFVVCVLAEGWGVRKVSWGSEKKRGQINGMDSV